MFISRLECPVCGFSSEAFGETADLYHDTYSIVFQRLDSNEIVVKEIPASRLREEAIDLDGADANRRLQETMAGEHERLVIMPRGKVDVSIDAVCPTCGNATLVKKLRGLQ